LKRQHLLPKLKKKRKNKRRIKIVKAKDEPRLQAVQQKRETKSEPVHLTQIWEVPNLVTCYRIFSALILFGFAWTNVSRWLVLTVYFTALASDKIDGTLARWLKKETPLGLRLEPIADSMLVYAILLYLFFHSDFPDWVLWLATAVLIIGGLATVIRTLLGKKEFYVPNFPESKAMVFLFHLTAIMYLFEIPYRWIAFDATLVGGVITFISYLVRMHYFHLEE